MKEVQYVHPQESGLPGTGKKLVPLMNRSLCMHFFFGFGPAIVFRVESAILTPHMTKESKAMCKLTNQFFFNQFFFKLERGGKKSHASSIGQEG
ncbi:MAG: hypothetical protein K0R57_2883 [Paenibacillaceae bacterium]|jgi:hypothetical protein|nr:hypothetical protein [Paenibacillaceae bacterium]